ncbi:N-acetylmuramoyl-L-alanine amidase [Paenibacillus chitinolyticus]|uniref:N-acetylmuramoyl-L-alanine amidase family protein n=1 Tax=Paenibacillus chitinolyticus TaxID=79263 RepID=UPI003868AFA1
MKKPVIVLDPGHGMNDPGAIGSGLMEKELTLKIASRIANKLQGLADVRMTRTDDTAFDTDKSADLKARCAFANRLQADYFVSVHINAGGGTGFESHVYSGTAASSRTETLRSVVHAKVAAAFAKYGLQDRGRKSGDLAVLRQTVMPAVLLEYGFIDRAADASLLKNEAFLDQLAASTAEGLAEAFSLGPLSVSPDKSRPQAQPDSSRTLEAAIAKLHEHGVIDSPAYWNNVMITGKTPDTEYTALLIRRMADKLRG